MRLLVTGGTGFIGRELLKHLTTHSVVLLTRNCEYANKQLLHTDLGNIEYIDSLSHLDDLNGFDAIINLAGEPIADKRWSAQQKRVICDSRWNITTQLVELIHASTEPPSVFISGSAVGYYGDQQDHLFDESLLVHQDNFAHQVCAKWEQIALRAQSQQTRVCLLRTGVVLGDNGGALAKMLLPYKLGLGGPIGRGEQYIPWIHLLDMVRGIVCLLETEHAQGPYNFCSPHAVTNKQFSATLASNLRRPHILFTPKWLLQLAMGESASLLIDSVRAKPSKLTEMGFNFTFPHIDSALKNIVGKIR
ncbi:TIGR01777 family oxidoreductase [Vibrio hippocampi]|uniref:Epimerase family protein n=1 Tax=Vibrio hippocampi TaxID=654686 RepID=A0ABM8ZII8_9VIBR|nr:TIGR01777 family oxidoreductase [Vibrio hippocampi]CAH0526634.1 Epimerase family protein [Vibrio hippocampi]